MIYFITEQYLKNFSTITKNVDTTDVASLTKTNAEMWFKYKLGSYFFNDLLSKYNAVTLTTDEEVVVEFIRNAVCWRIASDAVLTLAYQLKNKGPQKQTSDNSTYTDKSENTLLMKHYQQKAEWFQEELDKYLISNKTLYPNFTSTLNSSSTLVKICGGSDSNFNIDMLFI